MKVSIISLISITLLFSIPIDAQKSLSISHIIKKNISYLLVNQTDSFKKKHCQLDICYPTNKKEYSTIIWFHGGGLESGSRNFPKELMNKEYAIVSVDYRLSPNVKNPAYIEDAAEAVAWVYRNIKEIGGDESKIYLAGHSAGGYLVLMLTLDKQYLGKWNIDANKIVTTFSISGQTTTHYTIRKERGLPMNIPIIDTYAPLNHIRKDVPPIILITGDKALEMPARYEENAYLYALLRDFGDKTNLYQEKGFNHNTVVGPACILIDKYICSKKE